MTNIIWPAQAGVAEVGAGMRTRHIVGLLSIVGYFCSTFEESLVSTVNGHWAPAHQLAYIVVHLDSIRMQVLFELLTPVFLLGMVFTLVGAIRARGVWPASAAGALGALGALALTIGAAVHLVALVLIDSGAPNAAVEAVLSAPLPDLVFYLFFAPPAAFIVLATAAWRARLITWVPFAIVCVFVALDLAGLLPEVVPLVLGLIGFCMIAWRLVRATKPAAIGDWKRPALDKMYESQQPGGDRTQV